MKKDIEKWNAIKQAKKNKIMITLSNQAGLFMIKKIQSNGKIKLDNSQFVNYDEIEITRLDNKMGIYDIE